MLPAAKLFFLDTEFTGLRGVPQLLSLALVSEQARGPSFYAEVTDSDRLGAASDFVQRKVISQFGRVDGAACGYRELGRRMVEFLDGGCGFLRSDFLVLGTDRDHKRRQRRIAFNSDWDWELMQAALRDADPAGFSVRRSQLLPNNIYNMPAFAAGERASEAYFEMQQLATYGRHHALCDARALRVAWRVASAALPQPNNEEVAR